eukprot:scaffold155_cov347-Pavlova_lutheri.AAC.73
MPFERKPGRAGATATSLARSGSVAERPGHVTAPRFVRLEHASTAPTCGFRVFWFHRLEVELATFVFACVLEQRRQPGVPRRRNGRTRWRRRATHVRRDVREAFPTTTCGQPPSTIAHVQRRGTSLELQSSHVGHLPVRLHVRMDAPGAFRIAVATRDLHLHVGIRDADAQRRRHRSCLATKTHLVHHAVLALVWKAPSHVHELGRFRRKRHRGAKVVSHGTCAQVQDDSLFAKHLLPSAMEGHGRPGTHLRRR